MTKTLIALALAGALIGCSSGSDDDGEAPPADGTPDNTPAGEGPTDDGTPPAEAPPATGGTPTTDSKAGVWLGSLENVGGGVYVIDNDNEIYGLALAEDGSANSVFGSLGEGDPFSGALDNHSHAASDPVSPGVFAQRGAAINATEYSLEFINGQTVSSGDAGVVLTFAAPGALTPATPESVAGSWQSSHSFCAGPDCFDVVMDVTFSGSDITGGTDVLSVDTGESNGFSPEISGTIAQFGDVLKTSFTWNEAAFSGVVYFAEDGRLVFNADDNDDSDPEHQTLSTIMTQQ